MSTKKDLTKMQLYESVKVLVDTKHTMIHLPQVKIYTIFSVAFQYLLYHSSKSVGHYIIRVQDPIFAQKLAKFAKDASTRKFMDKLLDAGKVQYGKSTLFLDTFHVGSWHKTKELKIESIQAVLIVKYALLKNMGEMALEDLSKDFYFGPFVGQIPKLVMIDPEEFYEDFHQIKFPLVTELIKSSQSDD